MASVQYYPRVTNPQEIQVVPTVLPKETKTMQPDPEPQAETERKKSTRLSFQEFFKLTEELRNRREVYTTECPSYSKTALIIRERLGFSVNRSQIEQAQEATNIKWEPKIHPNRPRTVSRAVHNLAKAVIAIYKEFEKEVPPEIEDIVKTVINNKT